MLEKYQKEQEKAVTILQNQINDGKMHHAYLFVVNDLSFGEEFALDFIKHFLQADVELKQRIDNNSLLDIKKIYPEEGIIKKGQIEDVQNEFSNKPFEIDSQIYIISGADKLNASAANTLLKFLEDPPLGVIAIMLTKNVESVLNTTKSRCCIIYLESVDRQKLDDQIKVAGKNFVIKYETNKETTFVYLEELIHSSIKEKKELEHFFLAIIFIYNEMLKHKIKSELYADEKLNAIIEKNTVRQLLEKISVLIKIKNMLYQNINQKLLIDKMFFLLEEIKDE